MLILLRQQESVVHTGKWPDIDMLLQGKGREHHYAVDSYFGEHRYSLFGKDAADEQQQQPSEHKRLLAEDEAALTFPLRASGRAAFKQLALLHRQVRAPFFD